MRILSWNVRRATPRSPAWEYFLACDADVALLQEVGGYPPAVRSSYRCLEAFPTGRRGTPQRFKTAVLVKETLGPPVLLRAGVEWVDAELSHFGGNLVAGEVEVRGRRWTAVSVYSPAWPVDPARLTGTDVSGVRLKLSRDVWVADLLWAVLRWGSAPATRDWVIGGDFNLSETFDLWRGGPRGNREYLDRMADLGLVECLRTSRGALTPTYRNTDKRTVKHQMDHLFVSPGLAARLRSCDVGPQDTIFGRNMSDHLPIIADFDPA